MNIPRPDHPVWRRLVTGEVAFHPSFLGACMFLTRVQVDRRQPGGRKRTAVHVGQLRAIYAQNRDCRSVRRDLARLRIREIYMADPDCGGWSGEEIRSGSADMPLPDHPVWDGLVSGAIPFQPSFLGACMFLTRFRTDPRRAGERSRAAARTRQLRALYAHNAECDSAQRDLMRLLWMSPDAREQPAPASRRRRWKYTMTVVAVDGSEHDLPADTVTREEPAPGTRGPYVPLAFRPQGEVFYVCSARWSELAGTALRLKPVHGAGGWRSPRGGPRRN